MFIVRFAVFLGFLVISVPAVFAQPKDPNKIQQDLEALAWQRGPTEASIGGLATVNVRDHQAFLDGPNTRRFL